MKNKKKKTLLVAALLIIAIASITTYAIYKSTATGRSGFKTAKWYIELNGEDITTKNTFTFDLYDADWTHNVEIDSDETDVVVIAPGSYGTFGIEIDASETEVNVLYTVVARILQNDREVDLSTINPNLSIGFYEDNTLIGTAVTGNIAAHGTYNGEIRIIWDAVDSGESNAADIAINDQDFVIEVTVSTSQDINTNPICVRANELHSTTCSDGACVDSIGNGNTIIYGNLNVTGGTLSAGDAFDCDVNNDGVYDPETERFYYVTDNGDKAVLIYYSNVTLSTSMDGLASDKDYEINRNDFVEDIEVKYLSYGDPYGDPYDDPYGDNSSDEDKYVVPSQETYSYSSYTNTKGPTIGYKQLPSITQWNNPKLVLPGNRQITNEYGETTSADGEIEVFSYTNKSARMITVQEVMDACNLSYSQLMNINDECNYFLENVGKYTSSYGTSGYWLETPYSAGPGRIWIMTASSEYQLNNNSTNTGSYYGIRPVIEVKKSNIDYSNSIDYASLMGNDPTLSNVVFPEGRNKLTVRVGEIVTIGTEEFYVVKHSDDDLVLLSRYNLNVGENKKAGATEGIQSPYVTGYKDGNNGYGNVAYANSASQKAFWKSSSYPNDYAFIVDDVYTAVHNYEQYLRNNFGVNIKSSRILKRSEAIQLGCTSAVSGNCNNAPSFLTETSFWLQTAYSDDLIYIIDTGGLLSGSFYSDRSHFGVRPVIII